MDFLMYPGNGDVLPEIKRAVLRLVDSNAAFAPDAVKFGNE
jgi:hypothetical protein